MNSNIKIYLQILLISLFLILSKYAISYFYIFDEDLLLKILRLEDIEYLFIVESFSRMDLKTDWSEIHKAQGIIGFPVFSVIWHSILFIFFKYYSLIILGLIFLFIIYLLIFKILCNLNFDKYESLFILLSLVTTIQLLECFGNIYDLKVFNLINRPLSEFIGSRFPRPLVTSIYLFLSLLSLQKISLNKNFKELKSYLILFCLSLSMLANSFFYLFLVISILGLLIFASNFKYNINFFLKKNFYFFMLCLSIITIGLFIAIIQNFFSESDYSNRIGLYNVNIENKLYLINHFFFKLFQLEMIILIFLCILFKFYLLKKKNVGNNNILFYFFVSSILSPFIFILFSNKMISLYHFWTIVKFSGFLFVFTSIFILFFNKFNKIVIPKYNFSLIVILLVLNILNSINLEKNINKESLMDLSSLRSYLIENDFKNSNINFFTNDYLVKHLWLDLDNNYVSIVDGFSLSQNDKQIEQTVLNIFKLFNVNNDKFYRILSEVDENVTKRNNFSAQYFNYKYSVNYLRHYKPLVDEYTNKEIEIIKITSPLVSYHTVIPKSEKLRLLDNYKKLSINKLIYPDLIILKKNSLFKENLINGKYKELYSNKNYKILKKEIF